MGLSHSGSAGHSHCSGGGSIPPRSTTRLALTCVKARSWFRPAFGGAQPTIEASRVFRASVTSRETKHMFYFYIFLCKDGTLYCGSTNNLENREQRHNQGRGAKYTKIHGGGSIVYSEFFNAIGDAMRREMQIKKWSKIKKENLIKGLKP